jgi:hypothetical protein
MGIEGGAAMKMRIQGNAIRLRLNRREVEQFAIEGRVNDSIQFPAGGALSYTVERTPAAPVLEAAYSPGKISIRVPDQAAQHWAESDEVGISGGDSTLEIVIEKDFQCMHKGAGARDPEAFPNPLAVQE